MCRADDSVVCTGGEPLLQLDEPALAALHAENFQVAVETNGTQTPPQGIDWLCVSPKAGARSSSARGTSSNSSIPKRAQRPSSSSTSIFSIFPAADGRSRARSEHESRAPLLPPPPTLAAQHLRCTKFWEFPERMFGYSDRINHALAFAAKYRGAAPTTGSDMGLVAQSANLAIILTRYSCDHVTIEAGILHHVLEESHPGHCPMLERKIGEKFGSVVLAVAKEAAEPKYDRFGQERPWQVYKRDHLAQLAAAEPRAVDICVADEIHRCGSTLAALRRLGVEYLRTVSRAGSDQAIWWYCSLVEILEARSEWSRRNMLGELRTLSTELVRSLRHNEEDL